MYISLLNILGAGDAAGMYWILIEKNIETFLHLIL